MRGRYSLKAAVQKTEEQLLREVLTKFPFESCRGLASMLGCDKSKISRIAKRAGIELKKVKHVTREDYFKLTDNALGTGGDRRYTTGTSNRSNGNPAQRRRSPIDAGITGREPGQSYSYQPRVRRPRPDAD